MKIYAASSWRCDRYDVIVAYLRAAGHEVYDFRDPAHAFDWRQIDPEWGGEAIPAGRYRQLLEHPRAVEGFARDMGALEEADAVVLITPCGASAHLEAGWAVGAGKPLFILTEQHQRPDLMYRMARLQTPWIDDIIVALADQPPAPRGLSCDKFDRPPVDEWPFEDEPPDPL